MPRVTIPHTTLLKITALSIASLPSPACIQYGRTEEEAADEEHTEDSAQGNHTKDGGQEDDPPCVICSVGECVGGGRGGKLLLQTVNSNWHKHLTLIQLLLTMLCISAMLCQCNQCKHMTQNAHKDSIWH